jgi:membrane-associated phospholipid phosphatase
MVRGGLGALLLLTLAVPGRAYERVEGAGDVATVVITAAAGATPLLLKDNEGAVQLVTAAALDLGVTMALKYGINERRPNGEDYHSFPSAHASVAFTSAEFLRKRYGWEYGLPAYGLASFIAYSRVEANQHYWRDVVAGAAIGMGSSYLFTTPRQNVTLQAAVAPGYYGFRLTKAW